MIKDPHSYSNYNSNPLEHLQINLLVDFTHQLLRGSVRLHFAHPFTNTPLFLDSRRLKIESIRSANGAPLNYQLHPAASEKPWMGQKLEIHPVAGEQEIQIAYQTHPEAPALQWLMPEQTAGGKHPFLFSQSQAVLARSWVPCQDSPSVRFTYEANIRVPEGMMALMSAENPKAINPDGLYHFRMQQPIPSYLLALAAGDIAYHAYDEQSGVYAEPKTLQATAEEFIDMPKMVHAAETLYGKYRWEQFDVLMLPPAFPFGGMENPRLTFATPTLLAGDRSLVSVIAHELAHSWSGNLVTNAAWNDFWLNEGFTVYFERRIMEAIEGREYAEMQEELGAADLLEELQILGETSPDTCLKLNLDARDPDDGMTHIAYEKGFFFIRFLEEALGRTAVDSFIKKYFTAHAFQSMDTEQFVQQLKEAFGEHLSPILPQINQWIYQAGLPEDWPRPTSSRFKKIREITMDDTFCANTLPAKNWTSHEWLCFLQAIPPSIGLDQLEDIDQCWHLTQSKNAEIVSLWLELAIQHNYRPAFARLESFLIHTGRRKFQIPLYKALVKTEQGKSLAREIYKKARPGYHYVSRRSLDEMVS